MRIFIWAMLALVAMACDENSPCPVTDNGEMRLCNQLIRAGDKRLDCNYQKDIPVSCFEKLSSLEGAYFFGTGFTNFHLLRKNKGLLSLEIDSPKLDSLEGIEMFPELENLCIAGTSVTDLSPLKKLRKLDTLNISETKIDDISVLFELKNFNHLNAHKTRVSPEQFELLWRKNPKVKIFTLHPDEYIHL